MARIAYWFTWLFCFWNALLFLINSARASIPAFVPKSVAKWWSGAPLVIIAWCSSYALHSNTMCLCVWSSSLHGQVVGSCMLCVR